MSELTGNSLIDRKRSK